MADNITLNAGTGGAMLATDDVGGTHHQLVKIEFGDADVATKVSATNPLPIDIEGDGLTALQLIDDIVHSIDGVAGASDKGVPPLAVRDDALAAIAPADGDYAPLRTNSRGALWVAHDGALSVQDGGNVLSIDDNGASLSIDDGGGSITIDGSVSVTGAVDTELTTADLDTGAGTDTRAVVGLVLAASGGGLLVGSANPMPVSDNGGSLTVDGSISITGDALTALQLIDDPVIADDAGFSIGSSKVMVAGFLVDETSPDSADEGDVGAARMTADRVLLVAERPRASGGYDAFRSLDLDETEEDVKTSAGQVFGWYIHNNAASVRYVKFYNDTAANVTVGTTTPKLTIPVPANGAANVEFRSGIAFSAAISVAATTGLADTDTGAPAANEVQVNVFYK